APFRGDGGVPSIQKDPRKVEIRSENTDFGESLYAKVGKSRSRNSSFSVTSPVGGRRRSKKPVGTLQDRLFQALVPTHEGKKEFFPRKVLSTIVNRKCVYKELSKHLADVHSKETIADYASKICGIDYGENGSRKVTCFRKIFVILVLIDKTPAITKFIEIGLSDSDLPLVLAKRMDSKGSKELRLSRNPEKNLSCFSKQWKQLHFRNFEAYQWTTLSPFFAKGGHKQVVHYPLQDHAILPFISSNPDGGRSGKTLAFEGGFSRNKSFAVKCLHSRDKKQFKKEVEMLRRFSDPDVPTNKHLVSLLATYRQFGAYFLIFHWADADLRRYWMEVNPTPTMDRHTVLWVAQQCRGIAEGVVAIHQYKSSKLRPQPKDEAFGHHGDIKPENVLWFPDQDHAKTKQGTLKLSDFGLAEMSVHHTRSMQPKSNFATSRSYQAPEVEIEGTGAIGRSYDMWTLGCLYLEFITWLMGGWDLVDTFNFDRIPEDFVLGQDCTTFYVLKPEILGKKWKQRAEIKPSFISQLLADDSCTEFLRDFIEMVRDDLLVIKTIDPQKRDRATCQEVLTRLGNMLHKCEHSVGYGYKVTSSPEHHE
ncbi:kinase-like domain-containing protein, partial [Leptodontidium sp. 2 PMI_412]